MYVNPKGKGKQNILKVGQVFTSNDGNVVEIVEYRNAKQVVIEFSDGVTSVVMASNLRRGSFFHPNKFSSLVGKRFKNKQGDWATIIEYVNASKIVIEFDGYPDKLKITNSSALRSGSFKNNYKPTICGMGYIGDGWASISKRSAESLVYDVWVNMLSRCYDDYTQSQQPAYIGCSVDERWHSLEVFAHWYLNHPFRGEGFHLDKDLLVKGNRVYSEEVCTLIPPEVNAALSIKPSPKSGLPIGVNKIDNGYVARLCTGETREYLGYYKTPEEAHEVYVKAKEDYIRRLAEKWKGQIEGKAYQALREWKFNVV